MRAELTARGEPHLDGSGCELAMKELAARAREHDARRQRRGQSDVNYGAEPEQVPAEGWIP